MSTSTLIIVLLILNIHFQPTAQSNVIKTSFTGKEYIDYKIPSRHDENPKDKITLKFKTVEASGVILYSCGDEGDFLLLEIKRGKLVYTGSFGSIDEDDGTHQIITDAQYNDNKWHQVALLRKDGSIHLTVDETTKSKTPNTDFEQLNLDKSFLVGGIGEKQRLDTTCRRNTDKKNFRGCLEDVHFNSNNLLYGAKEMFQGYTVNGGSLPFTCEKEEVEIIGLHSTQSHLVATRDILEKNELNINMELRTFEPNGHIFTHKATDGNAVLNLVNGKVELMLVFLELTMNDAVTVKSDAKIDDGDWHKVSVVIKRNESEILLTVNEVPKRYKFLPHFKLTHELGLFSASVRFGGNTVSHPGLETCFKKIEVDGEAVSVKLNHQVKSKHLISEVCQIRDLCFPSPCQHGSTCTQSRGSFQCNCNNTGYSGSQCQTCIYERTCEDYKNSGDTESGNYKVCPKNDQIFDVYCDMKSGATIFKHGLKKDTRVGDGKLFSDYFYHDLNYLTTLENIRQLMNVSLTCKQYIRYDCFKSHLLYGVGRLRNVHFKGARWMASNSVIQHYWGGAKPESMKCGCAMDGTCAKDANGHQMDCNCDLADNNWRYDAGYLSDKKHLPVLQLQFSKGPETNEDSYFTVGHLSCYGTIKPPTKPPTTVATTPTVKTLKPIMIGGKMFFNTSKGQIPVKPILIDGRYYFNNSGVLQLYPGENDIGINTEASRRGDSIESLFSKPWLVSLIVIGSILCLLLVFMVYLLFRKNIYESFVKCVYGKHANKPRIEIEDYNRYSTATEEESDWDIYRLSTTFPTSTPEPSYGPTDDESVNMRVRTLEDIRGKRRFKGLTGWGSRTASAPTVVGSLSKYNLSECDESLCLPNPETKMLPNDYETMKQNGSEPSGVYEYVKSERAYSTTATDGECDDSVIDDSVSEFSNKSSHHSSNASSMKESECSSVAPLRTSSRASAMSDGSKTGDVTNDRNCRIGYQPAGQNPKPNGIHPIKMSSNSSNKGSYLPSGEPAVKTFYPVLPFTGSYRQQQQQQAGVRRAHPAEYGVSHNASNGGARCPRYLAVNGRRPSNSTDYSNMIKHQTIQERDELSDEEIQPAKYENQRNSDGFYEFYDHGEHGSPSSETRLLFDDASSREECVREADEQIKLLKKKVIEKATSADECT